MSTLAGPGPRGPGRIFISYRREETAYPAGWLGDRLVERFGEAQVFKDVRSIDPGKDFVDEITSAVASCDVLLALIGVRWATITDDEGRRRLDHPDDFVRLEIEAALARDILVIPILVEGARMPEPDDIPPALAKLARRQALELSPSRFESDLDRLLKVLAKSSRVVQVPVPKPADDDATRPVVAAPEANRRRFGSSISRARLIGIGAPIGLLLLVSIVVVSMSDGGSSGVIFRDDFSGRAAGWFPSGPARGDYGKGVYRMELDPASDGGNVASLPMKAASVYPSAPTNVRVELKARRVSRNGTDTGLFLLCRGNGDNAYVFTMGDDYVAIAKTRGQAPFYQELKVAPSHIDPSAETILSAVCQDEGSRQHLSFSLNNEPVVDVNDDVEPFSTGTVGFGVSVGPGSNSIIAEFDDFVVTRAS